MHPIPINRFERRLIQPLCYCVLFFLLLIAFGYGISAYAILDMNEGLYAEIAREMLGTHHYVIPHLNALPYLEKPPLFYWLLAISYQLLGVSTFAARIIPSLSACVACLTLLLLTYNTQHARAGLLAAIILASSVGFIIIGRMVFFDMLLTTWFTLALTFFYCWFTREKNYYLYASYFAIALAFLTKGLLPVLLAGGITVVFLAIKSPREKLLRFFNPLGICLFLLITIPWHLAAIYKLPGFAWDYFINEQLYRFLDKRIPHDYHTGPLYYYLPRIIVYLFPWSLTIPLLFGKIHGKLSAQDPLKLLLWLWLFIPLLFFSISLAKGDYYMVLSMPALALLLGLKFDQHLTQNNSRWLTVLFVSYALLLIAAASYILSRHLMPAVMTHSLVILLLFLVIYSSLGVLLIQRTRQALLSFLLLAGLCVPLIIFYVNFRVTLQNHYSQLNLAQYIQQHDPQRPIYLYQDYEKISSLLFFVGPRLPIIDSVSNDLYYGSHRSEASGWFPSAVQFKQQALSRACYVVLLKSKLAGFQQLMAPQHFCLLAQNDAAALLEQCQPSA